MTNDEIIKLLTEIKSDLKFLRKDFENHLSHHFKYTFYAWTVAIGLIITLVIMIL